MKRSVKVSSSRRTQRRNLYTAPSSQRRKIMSVRLSKALRLKHKIRNLPIRKNDTVKVCKGKLKNKTGKVTAVYRKRWVIHIEKLSKQNTNGQPGNIPIKPSNCAIDTLHLDKDRQNTLIHI